MMLQIKNTARWALGEPQVYKEYYAHDFNVIKQFYRALFGWEFKDVDQGILHENKIFSCRFTRHCRFPNGSPLLTVQTTHLEKTMYAVLLHGGLISRMPGRFPGGRGFHFKDPSGNELAVWSEEDADAASEKRI